MKQSIMTWWKGLLPRERWVLLFGAGLVGLILFYQIIWFPWHHAIGQMQESIVNHRKDLVWMRQQAEFLKKSGGVPPRQDAQGANASLMSILESTAKKSAVRDAIQQLVPRQNNQQVAVVLEGVSFNRWVSWIDNLETNYGVTIIELDAERDSEKPDTAEIRVTFSR